MATYVPSIGLEVHAELSTATKIFCGCSTASGSAPNTQVCPICLGFPGVLPMLNRNVVEYGMRMALALNCSISSPSIFERKGYYYPDLPKNFQISQKRAPSASTAIWTWWPKASRSACASPTCTWKRTRRNCCIPKASRITPW